MTRIYQTIISMLFIFSLSAVSNAAMNPSAKKMANLQAARSASTTTTRSKKVISGVSKGSTTSRKAKSTY